MANVGGQAAQYAGLGATAGSVLPGVGTAVGAGVGFLVGGITSLFGGQSEADAINERIRRAQALAAESLVDSGEIANRLNSIDRMFNQRLTSVLNTTAIRSRGYANQGTIGAAVAGGIEGDRLAAKNQTLDTTLQYNKQVQQSIAQMELGTASANPINDFMTGGIAGLTTGIEAAKYIGNLGESASLNQTQGQTPLQGQRMPQPMANATTQNPYLPKSQSVTTPMGTANSMQLNVNNPHMNSQNPFSAILAMTTPTRQGSVTVDSDWGYQFPDGKTFGAWGGWK